MKEMSHFKRPSDHLQTNGENCEPKRRKKNETAYEKLNISNGACNNKTRCLICLWPIQSSKCYHLQQQQVDNSYVYDCYK